ncbi:MAG: hypothetical protein JWO72_2274 [Caulobacteraceae bacterium]|nr:hypothetical protein [Caulobacteraceae bacterium]
MAGWRPLGVCLAAALALAACSPEPASDSGAASSQPADLSWYLEPAFKAAFGGSPPVAREVERQDGKATVQYSPNMLVDLGGDRVALVSTGALEGCQDCGGAVAIHYLQRSGGEFHVVGQWLDLRPRASVGALPEAHVRTDLFARPALQIELPDRNQGCETASASLFELEPGGPILRARDIVTARSNIAMGAVRVGPMIDDYGNILPDVKGERFRVAYRGTLPGEVIYAPGKPQGVWTPQGEFKLPEC